MIKTDITVGVGFKESDIIAGVSERLGVDKSEFNLIKILRSHLDFSNKSNIYYKLTVAIEASPEREAGLLKMRKKAFPYSYMQYIPPKSSLKAPPIIVGAGPAGLFCALTLAEAGAMPILIERGESVEDRMNTVSRFFKTAELNPESNVQFGEGGAGTFSDGKLKVGSCDEYKIKVLMEFVNAGADSDILHSSSAHLGTDKLPSIIKKIREKIIFLGGEIRFSSRLAGINIKNGKVDSVKISSLGHEYVLPAEKLILATGHSADDVFRLLSTLGAPMQARGFGIGMRIEHNREYINTLQYGKDYSSELPTASYHLVTHLPTGRSVYSFCMCPGGTVVPATSSLGHIVTNGMSEYGRDAENSNSAILVSVTPEDFESDSPLAGIELQKNIEQAAYKAAGCNYRAPAIRLDSFMRGESSAEFASVIPSYTLGTEKICPQKYLPEYITASIKAAMPDFDAWMKGFYSPEAVLTGAETRSTSPIKVLRNEKYHVPNIEGLYPIGEGAGYAGGIVSSATDGIKCADSILKNS